MRILYCEACMVCPKLLRGEKKQCPHCGGKLLGGKSKYGNSKIVVDGVKFDSLKEARRHGVLVQLEAMGVIKDLELQPRYDCEVFGVFICFWKGDFRYKDVATDAVVVEDAKGFKTAIYRLKKRLVEALHGIKIMEV